MSREFPDFVPPTKISYISGRPTTLHLRKCKLVREDGEHAAEYIFDQSKIAIGAMNDNDLTIEDETVSRYHCHIRQEDDNYIITDLGSTNGTFVNRVRVKEAYLKPGCTVGLGQTELRFHIMDERVEILPSKQEAFGGIVGKSVAIREIFGILEKIAPTNATVVVEGESGTGKEVVAKTLHQFSARKDKPFIIADCTAIQKNLIESELFGHEKGSFTGALMTRQGLFEMAQGGTIFLDEIGELSLDLQPKLLRALEQREIRRVGSNRSISLDVRVVAATNRNLKDEVAAGRFREDLFYRLSVVRVILPPLRDRREDIPLLVEHFLRSAPYNRGPGGKALIKGTSRESMDALVNYGWPGNVRELVNIIERACSFADEEYIQPADLPTGVSGVNVIRHRVEPDETTVDQAFVPAPSSFNRSFKEAKGNLVAAFERDYIAALLKKNNHNISHAAREAQIDRKYFRKLMNKYGLATGDDDE